MLNRDNIATLLDELASELEAEGVHGDLFLVGAPQWRLPTAHGEPPATWTPYSSPSR
jgi:hypothetical protein